MPPRAHPQEHAVDDDSIVPAREALRASRQFTSSWEAAVRCCDVQRIGSINLRRLYNEVEPALVEGLWSSRPALGWTLEELVARFGDVDVEFTAIKGGRSMKKQEGKLTMSFAKFVRLVLWSSHENNAWMLNEDIISAVAELEREIGPSPSEFGDNWFEYFPVEMRDGIALVIGGTGGASSLHADAYNWTGWNVLFKGRKVWRFLPPSTSGELLCAKTAPKGQNLTRSWLSPIDLFEVQTSLGYGPGPVSAERCLDSEGEARLRATMLEFIQEAGETVLIPPGWWHQVYHLGPTLGVAGQYLNEHNAEAVFGSMLSHAGADKAHALLQAGEAPQSRVKRVLAVVESAQHDTRQGTIYPAELLEGTSKDGSLVEVSSGPLDLTFATRLPAVEGAGWDNEPFLRRGPLETAANPLPETFSERHGEDCPSRHPGAAFLWTPPEAATRVASIKYAYVVIDGGVVSLHKESNLPGQPGLYHAWAGVAIDMLLKSSLAHRRGTIGIHVPRGLGSLRVADAVLATREAGFASMRQVAAKGWEWYDYPERLGDGVDKCSVEPRALVRVYGRVAAMNRALSLNYYHWTIDTLPFIAEIAKRESQLPISVSRRRLRYLTYASHFASQYLAAIGIHVDDIVTVRPCEIYFGKEVLVPISVGSGLHLSRQHYTIIRAAVLPVLNSHWPVPSSPPTGRPACSPAMVVIRGRDSTKRSWLTNAPALAAAVRDELPLPRGDVAEQVELGMRPLREQVKLFHEAGFVVAMEGSALANIVFMRPHTAAVSLTPTQGLASGCGETCYWHLASAVGVRFWSFLLPQNAWWDEHVTVPIDRLREFLSAVGRELQCQGES